MPMPGYVFRDGGPIPDSELSDPRISQTRPLGDFGDIQSTQRENVLQHSASNSSAANTPTSSASASNAPTDSHALAQADHDDKGLAQLGHDGPGEVRDLGWHEDKKVLPTLVGGLSNEDLWTLIRRFNRQMYHVKATHEPLLAGLDLNIADEDEFSPDKLRAGVERLYMTVIIGMVGFGKHIARLRSWREPRRTAGFCAAYFIAWIFNFIVPLAFSTVIVLIAYPPSRSYLFPPAPLALIDSKTGGIQSPKAGVLGSHDSITGAPEKHRGEAVEQEAHNFVSGIGSIALSSATGKHEPGEKDSDPLSKSVPDPSDIAVAGADAKSSASGGIGSHDKQTKQPMEDVMWSKMRPVMHIVGDVADGWERFANALSPTPPFPKEAHRLRLAGILVPAVAGALLTTSSMFMKMTTLFFGIGFFGDPVTLRAVRLLNEKIPNWQRYVELRNTILKGVPTNAQLTITLLRIGEANKAPLPPPPTSDVPPPNRPKSINGDDLTVDASNAEIHDAIHANPADQSSDTASTASKPKHKHGSHILNFLKGTTKGGVNTKLSVDSVRAKIGSTHAKNHLGVLTDGEGPNPSGPTNFKARYQGKKGYLYITTSPNVGPLLSFAKDTSEYPEPELELEKMAVSVPVEEIRELKKVGGLGWKAKIVVGWATGKTVADGMEIVDGAGVVWKFTAIKLREELFNRLIAMGHQKWESW